MSETTKVLLVIGLIVLGFVAYNSDSNEQPAIKTSTPTVVQTTPFVAPKADRQVNAMSAAERQAFLDGCIDSVEDNREYCVCTFNYLNARLTVDEFYEIADDTVNGYLSDTFWDAVYNCS